MEIYSFFVLFFLALFASLLKLKLRLISIILVMSHFYIVRYSGFDADMNVYMRSIQLPITGWYYFREPLVWFGLKFTYQITESLELSVLILDFVAVVVIFWSFRMLRLHTGHFLGFFLLSPVILGYENIYRQFISEIFAVLAFTLAIEKRKRNSFISFFLSVASHNAGLAFAPSYIAISEKVSIRVIAWCGVLFFLGILPFVIETKSSLSYSGARLSAIYLLSLFAIAALMALMVVQQGLEMKRISLFVLILFFLALIGFVFLDPDISERFSMYALVLSIVAFWSLCEKRLRNWRGLIPFATIIVGFLSIFFVEASYMLDTG